MIMSDKLHLLNRGLMFDLFSVSRNFAPILGNFVI